MASDEQQCTRGQLIADFDALDFARQGQLVEAAAQLMAEMILSRCPVPWCNSWMPVEHVIHTSEVRQVPSSTTELVAPSEGFNVKDTDVSVGLWQFHREETFVLVNLGDDVQIRLTLPEARQLAQHLTELCAEAMTQGPDDVTAHRSIRD